MFFHFDAKTLILLYNKELSEFLKTTRENCMAVEPTPGGQNQGESRPESSNFQDRTFMGGIGVATRSSLFVILGLVVLVAGGFGLFLADEELSKSDSSFRKAVQLNAFAAGIERDVWRIRAESGELSKRLASRQFPTSDAEIAATQEHVALANAVGLRLDELYLRPDTAPISEHLSTLREAVAQYMEQYDKSAKAEDEPAPDISANEAALRRSINAIGKTLAGLNILSLNETMTEIRAASTAFIESGADRDLIIIETHQKEFVQLLGSVPMSDDDKASLNKGLLDFNEAFAAYAKVRLVRDFTRDRLEEIVSYMAPSVDAIVEYTGDNLLQVDTQRQALRQQFRTFIAAGIAGSVLLVLLFGLAMMRSITGPVIAAGKAARHLSAGNADIVVWGLANEDETGDIARAFWDIKGSLKEAGKLRESMKKAKAEAERGRAATEEAEWLRRDLESMKYEADKGKEALAEVALLRKIIDATSDNISRNQTPESSENEVEPTPAEPVTSAPETAQEPTLDSISSISRKVAQSSESVTAAADEAERTGTLIRNLSDAGEKIGTIEGLISAIAEQADMLVVSAPDQGPDTNLVILNGDADKSEPNRPDGVTRRFDAIRSAAGQATWALRDIAALVKESREVALKLARMSSAEALEVTTDLLQQSENLRGMLDKLVNRMQDQITDKNTDDAKEGDGPIIA